MKFTLLKTILLALALLALALPAPRAAQPPAKPNIIFILADDLGTGNIGCYGAQYKTPRIDQLAQNGIRFTNGYTAPLCGPSRALIMTGRYAFRTGATNQDATGRMKPQDETFIPKVLKTAGYVSGMTGKWGQLPLGPGEFGFDEYLSFKGSGIYWNTPSKKVAYNQNGQNKELGDKEYMPDLMHNFAVDFITRHREDPFFFYYSLSHIHGEIVRTPDSAPETTDFYEDNIAYMDKLVGKLIDELERLKLREKTLVIFMGDNGTAENYSDRSTVNGKRLSGAKGSMLEGGALVPLIVNWPGISPNGQVSHDLVDSTDLLPTFAELTGAEMPKTTIDGRSFAPQVRGEKGQPREWIFIELARMWYVREAGWKLNEKGELYDMSGAPWEEKLVGPDAKSPEAAAARQRLKAALDKLNPAGGFLDDGDGTGRHASRNKKKAKANE